jgi:hypothetical protein
LTSGEPIAAGVAVRDRKSRRGLRRNHLDVRPTRGARGPCHTDRSSSSSGMRSRRATAAPT